jgi:hypothetical protein
LKRLYRAERTSADSPSPPISPCPIDEGVRDDLDMAYRIWNTDADDLRERIDAIRSDGESPKPT